MSFWVLMLLFGATGDVTYAKRGSELGPVSAPQKAALISLAEALFPNIAPAAFDVFRCNRAGSGYDEWLCHAEDLPTLTDQQLAQKIVGKESIRDLTPSGDDWIIREDHDNPNGASSASQMQTVFYDICSLNLSAIQSWSVRRDGNNVYVTCDPIVSDTAANHNDDYVAGNVIHSYSIEE